MFNTPTEPVDITSTRYTSHSIRSPLTTLEEEMQAKEEVHFLRSQNYCVCFIQMVKPTTATTSTIATTTINDSDSIRRHYTIFINTMSTIARNFGAKIVKNVADRLIIYFPQTSDPTDDVAFQNVIECGITSLAAGEAINAKLTEEKLAAATYRISADYGKIEVAESKTSQHEDLFGPTMNLCSKINSKAQPNTMIIGGDLYLVIRSLHSYSSFKKKGYEFKEIKGHSITGFRYEYPIYSLISKHSRKHSDPAFNLSTWHDKPTQELETKQVHSPAISTSPTTHISSGYNIMVVDDEKDILYNFNLALTENGYNVETFSNSQEALNRFQEVGRSHFDLVVLDLRMAGLNGLELYKRLKSISTDVKILFVSALDVVPEIVSVLTDVKNDDILRKPISMEELIRAVKKRHQIF
jgi:two-component system, OmpR family, response regulator ChvI